MSIEHDVLFEMAQESLVAVHGQTADYIAADGTETVLVNVMVGVETTEEVDELDGLKERAIRHAIILTEPTHREYSGVETVRPNATMRINSNIYSVVDIRSGDRYGQTVVKLARKLQKEKTRAEYRRNF
jgi:hypothetical protein